MKALLLLLCLPVLVWAQPPDLLWQRSYGGLRSDVCDAVLATADGGFLLAGETRSFGNGNDSEGPDIWLLKVNADGDSVWSRSLGSPLAETFGSVAAAPEGGFVVIYNTDIAFPSACTIRMTRISASGDSLWSRDFGGSNPPGRGNIVRPTSDGGWIIAGVAGPTWSDERVWLIHTDASGVLLWERQFCTSTYTGCTCVEELEQGGYVVAGHLETAQGIMTPYDFFVIVTQANGDSVQGYRSPMGDFNHLIRSTILTPEQDFLLCGGHWNCNNTENAANVWVLRAAATADTLWSRTYGFCRPESGGIGEAYDMLPTPDGGYYITGSASLMKLDAQFDSLWSRHDTIGGVALAQTLDGGCAVGGFIVSTESGWDFALARYASQMSAPPKQSPDLPQDIRLSCAPNPFNPATRIALVLPRAGEVQLAVYTLTGRKVKTLMDGYSPAGEQTISFNGTGLPSGIYYARLEAGTASCTQKLLLLK